MAVGTTAFPTALDTAVELVECANNAATALNGAIDDSVTTITVDSTTLFPTSGLISIDSEIISYTGKTGTTFTGCTRGVDGSSAASHLDNADVEGLITSLHHEALRGAIIAIETKLGSGSDVAASGQYLRGTDAGVSEWNTIQAADLPTGIDAAKLADGSINNTELQYLNGVTSAIQTQLDGKSATGHNHSGVYQPLDSTLTAFAAYNTNGLLTQTAADTFTGRTITGTSDKIDVANGDGVSGNPAITISATYVGQTSITTLGTVTTGTLSTGAVLGGVTMTLGSDADGDTYYRASNVLTRVPKGTAGQVYTMNAGATAPEWADAAGGGLTVGTTAIASGTAGRILYETSGNVLGEAAGFDYQPAASPNVTITAQNASYVPLRVNSAATPSANIFETTVNGGADTGLRVTSSGTIRVPVGSSTDAGVKFGTGSYGIYNRSTNWISLTSGAANPPIDFYVASASRVGLAQQSDVRWSGSIGDATTAAATVLSQIAFLNPGLEVTTGTTDQNLPFISGYRDAGTTTVVTGLTIRRQSSGTPAAGLGGALLFNISSSTTVNQDAAQIAALWTDATHASRSAATSFRIVDNAASLREAFRIAGDGANTATVVTQTGVSGATNATGILEENVTLSTSGATTDTSIQIPANSFVLSVSYRITTTIAGVDSTDIQLGDASTATRFRSGASALTSGTTGVGLNQLQGGVATDATGPIATSATAIRVTLSGGADNTPTGGAIRITIHYITLTAPTS